ncbi:MAG: A/G-specific adenine glycosylase [Ruminococcaceae bacterium]|nr:A/G-specific adenine glycosylase [Oscillospiraceae bacterium]
MKEIRELFTEQGVSQLLNWYRANRRALPWRQTRDPYHIWLSEIMLQQTRVEAVKPYYARFLEACPTIEALAQLPAERLMKLWEGLGYYSRARNLQKAAQTVVAQYGGQLPASYEELLGLCGIGEYTAGAIASIAFGIRVPAIDGNVLRVLARLQGSFEDITQPAVKKAWREALGAVIPEAAGDFTQAMIELGATVCGPNGEPKCAACPFTSACVAAKEHLTDALPVRAAKKARRVEQKTVLLIRDGDRTALHKRPDCGLLAGLFELPNVEGHLDADALPAYLRSIGFEPLRIERLEDSKHIFSHIEWHMIAYDVRITAEFDGFHGGSGMYLVRNEDLHANYAIPSAFAAYKRYL